MKIALVTDAWTPQINGVVRTLQRTTEQLETWGHTVVRISPEQFRTIPCPTYPDIRLALVWPSTIGARLLAEAPDAVHIATEGPLGAAARRWCATNDWRFTTAYHTRFPEYVQVRAGVPQAITWSIVRWFHKAADAVMVATPSLAQELTQAGLPHTRLWGRGVDLALFQPGAEPPAMLRDLGGPVQVYVGRVTSEKNLDAFLRCRTPGTKVVVGDGPERAALQARYPDVLFTGALTGAPLAGAFARADVFVFPSLTDTYGIVLLEALACGVPVAAFPVTGPLDVIGRDGRGGPVRVSRPIGALDDDLDAAIVRALDCDRQDCRRFAEHFSWAACSRQFLDNLTAVHPAPALRIAAE